MYFYALSFLILFVLSLFEIFQENLKNSYISKSLLIILVILFAIFSGIRYKIGVDYASYLSIFRHVSSTFNPPYSNLETGFKVLIIFFKSLNFPYISLFFVFSAILLTFLLRGIDKVSKYKLFSLFLFFMIFLITYVFNVLRQGIAMAIFIYLIPDIKNRSLSKVTIFSLLAASIHSSGIFILISYFLYSFSFSRKMYFILTGMSIFYFFNNQHFINFFIIILPNVLSSRLSNFITKFPGGVDVTSFLLRLVILSIMLLYYNKIKQIKGYSGLFNIYFFGFLIYVVFSFQGEFSTRINMFFRILEIILLPAVIHTENNRLIKLMVFLVIVFIAASIFFMTLRNPLNFPFNVYWTAT